MQKETNSGSPQVIPTFIHRYEGINEFIKKSMYAIYDIRLLYFIFSRRGGESFAKKVCYDMIEHMTSILNLGALSGYLFANHETLTEEKLYDSYNVLIDIDNVFRMPASFYLEQLLKQLNKLSGDIDNTISDKYIISPTNIMIGGSVTYQPFSS